MCSEDGSTIVLSSAIFLDPRLCVYLAILERYVSFGSMRTAC